MEEHSKISTQAGQGAHRATLLLGSLLLAMDGRDDALLPIEGLPDSEGPLMLAEDPLTDSKAPLLLEDDALPDRRGPLRLPEELWAGSREPLPLWGRPSWCWRSQALTSMRFRGVVRSAEASDGIERLLRMLVRGFPAGMGSLSLLSCCPLAEPPCPGAQQPTVSPSGRTECRHGHAAGGHIWEGILHADKGTCCCRRVVRIVGTLGAELLGGIVGKGPPAAGAALEGALLHAVAGEQPAAQPV